MHRIAFIAASAIGLITLGLEILYRHAAHPYYMWHAIPIFDLIFGALGCGALALTAKWLGHIILQRNNTYYEDDRG